MSIMVTDIEKEFQKRKELVENEYAKFASLTKSLKYYEVLYNVELIIHVVATDEVMECMIKEGFSKVYGVKDLAGLDRVVVGQLRQSDDFLAEL